MIYFSRPRDIIHAPYILRRYPGSMAWANAQARRKIEHPDVADFFATRYRYA